MSKETSNTVLKWVLAIPITFFAMLGVQTALVLWFNPQAGKYLIDLEPNEERVVIQPNSLKFIDSLRIKGN